MTHGHALLVGIDEYPNLGERFRLRACKRDVELMRELLERRSFSVRSLVDAEASRFSMIQAMQKLLDDARAGDTVVLYFSGHGSRRRRADGSGFEETLVPADSGRPMPGRRATANRDIADRDIRSWLRLITPRVAHAALIFDCCHSGGMVREGLSARYRQIPEENRQNRPAPVDWQAQEDAHLGPASGRVYTMLAACRPFELAFELEEERQGALTFHFARALERCGANATYRDLFQELGAHVTDRFPTQHPVVEGSLDRFPFAATAEPSRPCVDILESEDGEKIRVAIGTIHGALPGWRLRVSAPESPEPIASIELTEVDSTSSFARLLPGEPCPRRKVRPGSRARLQAYGAGDRRLRVAIGEDVKSRPGLGESLLSLIARSPLLETSERSTARLHVDLVEVRESDATTSLEKEKARLFLSVHTEDGELALPPVPWPELGPSGESLAALLFNLENMSRARALLGLENPSPSLAPSQVQLGLYLLVSDRWSPIEGRIVAPGDRLGLAIANHSDFELFPYLLNFGLSGRVSVLYPPSGAYQPLPPRGRVELGMAPEGSPIFLRVPPSLPFETKLGRKPPRRGRTESIKLFMARRQTDFSFLRQDGHRSNQPRAGASPLEQVLWSTWTGGETHRLVRCRPASDTYAWISLVRSFEVEIV